MLTATGGLAAVVALAGCTSDQDDAAPSSGTPRPHSTTSPKESPTSDRAEHVPGETVTKAPVLPDGEAVAQAANAHGNQEIEIRGGIKAGSLAILVNCQGKGTLTVSVAPVGLSFPLECVEGEVSSTFNQLDLKSSRKSGVVTVTAPSRVHWALTVGQ
ncbi:MULTISPECIES: hypothetical protein [Streptomyces]|uniref:Uncharacterized protein n=1 Tax=Streptomyces avermitilis TaxID=33903 RepID=A0A4D4MTV8_STRAX|nr:MULTISPECIES: hypothetical protein [Streptomyces]GDY64243.1 hypothetical protein SAV14893_036360 [Streptomyces avermitilis]GDY75598.1 hypothetical protein SAV31267_050830 [Streptomyces avermitilis]GDY84577.1 hypothetical protein SAVCW2_37760 [Streptomyces avermitilis]